ncbi:hypothetical protein ACFHWW_27400 [Ensifer sp. P24N7]|uniref:hypothetical protein n=1 Tax=Sinorhizobium sp. P24N7 TaxID=3348358 RepID=UPI0035F3480E
MSTTPYPVPRSTRQTDILVGNGGKIYGPFDGLQIFDNEDVVVYTRTAAGQPFTPVAVTVVKVSGLSFDFFTIEFPEDVPSTTEFVVSSERVAERSAGVKKGTMLDMTALEKELSKIATTNQELRRDVDRAARIEFGAPPLSIASDLNDGDTLMKQGERLVTGPNFLDAVAQAEAARDIAVAAASNAVSQGSVPIYATVVSMPTVEVPAGIKTIRVNGYYEEGDGGGGEFTQTSNGTSTLFSSGGSTARAWYIVGDVLNIRSFGAKLDGVTDDTAAVVKAGSPTFAGKEIRFPPKTCVVQGSLPVNNRFIGVVGDVHFKVTVNGGTDMNSDRGFWLKDKGQMHNIIFERGVTAGSISGEFNNAVVIGEYYTHGTEYSNIHMSNITMIGVDAGVGRRSIFGLYGNVHDCTFKNFKFKGFISYAFMNHWGGNFDPAAPDTSSVTASWHPRRIKIDGVFMENPAPDAGLGCIYLSGVHDYDIRNVFINGVRTPIVVAAGDVGGLVAQGDSVGQVLKNISFDNCTLLNYQTAGVLMSGVSGTRAGALWLAINEGSLVTFNNLVIRRGALSASARAIDARLMTGLRIKGLEITHENDAFQDILTPAIFLQACDDTEISGRTKVPFATELVGCGKKVKIDTNDDCLRTDYNTACYATRLTGQSGAHALGAALSIGDQTVTLQSLAFDVVAGSTIAVGGRTMVLTKAAAQSATPVVLSITPSFVAAAALAPATVEKYTGDIDLDGYAEGFYVGLLCNNTTSGRARGVVSSRNFRRSGLYDIYGRAVRGLRVDGSFKEGNQLDDANGDNMRLINGCSDVVVNAPSFEDNDDASTKARRNIYLFGDTVAFRAVAPAFFNAQLSAVNYFAPSVSGEMQPSFVGAYFGPLLPNRITGTGVAKGATIGDKQTYFVTSAPVASLGSNGDEAILETIVSGQPERWRKSAGAWVVLATAP